MTHLTDIQRGLLREKLLAMRVTLKERSDAAAEETRPVSLDQPIGRLTRMDAIQQQHMALGQVQRLAQERQAIEAALGRIAQDRYGLCVRCESEIPYERLTVRPTSPLCLDCQSSLEKSTR